MAAAGPLVVARSQGTCGSGSGARCVLDAHGIREGPATAAFAAVAVAAAAAAASKLGCRPDIDPEFFIEDGWFGASKGPSAVK